MKTKINNKEELIKFKEQLKSNITIYEGKPGCGKSYYAKSEINNLSFLKNNLVYVMDSENEYKNFNNENIKIIDCKNISTERFWNILKQIDEETNKLKLGEKAIVYIEEFNQLCRDRKDQIKFVEYAKKVKYKISFVLIVRALNFMDEVVRNLYLLYSERYEFTRN